MGAQTEAVPYEEIVAQLEPGEKVALVTCNTCVRVCETGGEAFMEEMARRLRADGFEVTDEVVTITACNRDYVFDAPMSGRQTATIVLACDVGWMAVVQRFRDRKCVKACKTTGLMSSVPKSRPKAGAAAS
ncbi:MAG TPA: hypothetical protein PLD23_09405 [Armatimonadota bacterium]|nr:hypothetical protein [Armatimonadota bacterium]